MDIFGVWVIFLPAIPMYVICMEDFSPGVVICVFSHVTSFKCIPLHSHRILLPTNLILAISLIETIFIVYQVCEKCSVHKRGFKHK